LLKVKIRLGWLNFRRISLLQSLRSRRPGKRGKGNVVNPFGPVIPAARALIQLKVTSATLKELNKLGGRKKMPKMNRVKSFLRKVPGKRKKVRVKAQLRRNPRKKR